MLRISSRPGNTSSASNYSRNMKFRCGLTIRFSFLSFCLLFFSRFVFFYLFFLGSDTICHLEETKAECGLRQSRCNLLRQHVVKRAVAILRNRTLIYALKFGNCPGRCASSGKHPARCTTHDRFRPGPARLSSAGVVHTRPV